MSRQRKKIVSPNAIRQGRLAMINYVIGTVTDIVTVTSAEAVREIEEVVVAVCEITHATVTKKETDRVSLRHQTKKKIKVKTKQAMTTGQKKQANKDSRVLAGILQNKIIFFPCNLYAQFRGA